MAVVRALLLRHVILVIIGRVSMQSGEEDPCHSPERIGNPRRNIHHVLHDQDDPITDTGLTEGLWYWFSQEGDDKMPETCPGVEHCGTMSPIWMNGSHPTDFNEKEVSVCSREGEGICCDWEATIKVKRCPRRNDRPEIFIYKLVDPPYDDMAYCAGRRRSCDRGDVYDPVRDACVLLFPAMDGFPVLSGPVIRDEAGKDKYFIFECRIAYSPADDQELASARFEVSFTFNGLASNIAPSVVVEGRNPVATLRDVQLAGNLGKTIKCTVESYWDWNTPTRSNPVVSPKGYFAGIKTTPPSPIVLNEGQTVNVSFISTIPVLFPRNTRRPHLNLRVERTSKHHRGSDCQVRFTETTWTGHVNSASATLVFKAIPDIATKRQPFLSATKFHPLNPRSLPIWKDYQVEDVIVNIKDEKKSAKCTASGDPHMTTFDGTYYDNFARGDFLMWKNTAPDMHQEIHVRQVRWIHNPRASAVCAVAVREHNTILGIDRCRGDPAKLITFLSETDVKRGTIHTINNREYEIKMASGLKVKVTFWGDRYVIIHVVVMGHHFDHTEGLCGSYNGHKGDDLHMRGLGMQHPQEDVRFPNKFIETYRVSQQDSYFRTAANCVQGTEPKFRCECQNLEKKKAKRYIECGLEVNGAREVTPLLAAGQNKCSLRRHKRSTEGEDKEADEDSDDVISLEDLLSPADTSLTPPPIDMSQPTPNNITMDKARERCNATLEASPAYDLCRDIVNTDEIINGCATDVMLGDSFEFTEGVREDLMTSCMIDVEATMVLVSSVNDNNSTEEILNGTVANGTASWDNETKVEDVTGRPGGNEQGAPDLAKQMAAMMEGMAKLRQIRMVSCPQDCNGQGTCVEGACNCTEGYIGEACSQRADARPRIITSDVICDKKLKACKHIRLHVADTTDAFKCRFLSKHHTDTAQILVKGNIEEELDGDFVTLGEVICHLPAVEDAREDTTAVEYTLSIANKEGAAVPSEPISVTVYNSKCVTSREEAGSKSYKLKTDFCLIGGACHSQDVVNSNDSRLACDPSNHLYDWTVQVVTTIVGTEMTAGTKSAIMSSLQSNYSAQEMTTAQTMDLTSPVYVVTTVDATEITTDTKSAIKSTLQSNYSSQEKSTAAGASAFSTAKREQMDVERTTSEEVVSKQTTNAVVAQTAETPTTSLPLLNEEGDSSDNKSPEDKKRPEQPFDIAPILATVVVLQVFLIVFVVVLIWYFKKRKQSRGQHNFTVEGKINEGYETPLDHF